MVIIFIISFYVCVEGEAGAVVGEGVVRLMGGSHWEAFLFKHQEVERIGYWTKKYLKHDPCTYVDN